MVTRFKVMLLESSHCPKLNWEYTDTYDFCEAGIARLVNMKYHRIDRFIWGEHSRGSLICRTNHVVVATQGAGKVSKNTTKHHHLLWNTQLSSFRMTAMCQVICCTAKSVNMMWKEGMWKDQLRFKAQVKSKENIALHTLSDGKV